MKEGVNGQVDEQFEGRIPPQNLDAEQSVLGAILLDPDSIVSVMEFLMPEDFYRVNHQVIFKAMVELNNDSSPIDIVSVAERLNQNKQLENAGGQFYLLELAEKVPTASNVEYYSKIVSEKSTLRKLIRTSTDIATDAYGETERMKNTGEITGIPTGYIDLDRMTSGLHSDELIILAARPSVGKTAFVLNIAKNVATKTNETVAIFSLEMSAESLVNRMLCSEGSIDASNMRNGRLTEEELRSYFVASGTLSNAPIYIDDTPGIRVSEIRAKCRRLKQERNNLGLIVIDYLQLIEGNGRESRQQEVSEISRNLKKLAKELSVPVIALSQLSRGVEQRQDKRPVMSDIRESGSIEQDADIVAFLYREDYYRQEPDEDGNVPEQESNNIIEVIIEKNRSGPRGTVELMFIKEYNKFTSIASKSLEASMPPM